MDDLFVGPDWTIRQLIMCIEANARGIALVVGKDRRLLATVTDGDIRRAILQGLDLSGSVQVLLDHKDPGPASAPITAPVGTDDATLLELMQRYSVRHIPLLDREGRVVGLSRLEDRWKI